MHYPLYFEMMCRMGANRRMITIPIIPIKPTLVNKIIVTPIKINGKLQI